MTMIIHLKVPAKHGTKKILKEILGEHSNKECSSLKELPGGQDYEIGWNFSIFKKIDFNIVDDLLEMFGLSNGDMY